MPKYKQAFVKYALFFTEDLSFIIIFLSQPSTGEAGGLIISPKRALLHASLTRIIVLVNVHVLVNDIFTYGTFTSTLETIRVNKVFFIIS